MKTKPLAERITQGPAVVDGRYPFLVRQGVHTAICDSRGISANDQIANAELIAEAFNVTHETGRTPRQLADERAELIAAMQEINEGFWLHPKDEAPGKANACRSKLVELLTRLNS